MFYLNVGWFWGRIPDPGPQGVVVNACGVDAPGAVRRRADVSLPGEVLFDPQLYLLALSPDSASKTCVRLASYPWFPCECLDDDAHDHIVEQWPSEIPEDQISELTREAIEFQTSFGVSKILAPSPLTTSPTSDLGQEMRWLDSGLSENNAEIPLLATFAVSDTCIADPRLEDNQLFQIAIDQFTAREELSGVFLVIENSHGESNRIIQTPVALSILEFCHNVGKEAGKEVIVNYADNFGIACIAAGASGFASGVFTKEKRLNLEDFSERGGGGLFPKFYSHSTIGDYLTERDLERVRDHRLLRLLEDDRTLASAALFDVLVAGGHVSGIPEWRESRNNTSGSIAHFVELTRSKTIEITDGNAEEQMRAVLTWLQDAESRTNYLIERFSDDPLSLDARHVQAWRSAFEQYLARHYPSLV